MRLFTEKEVHHLVDTFVQIGLEYGERRARIERRYQNRKWTAILMAVLGSIVSALSAYAQEPTPWTPERIEAFGAWSLELGAAIAQDRYEPHLDANGDGRVTGADYSAEIARINALPPDEGPWPPGAWSPSGFAAVIEIDRDLPTTAALAQEGTLFVVRGEALDELRAMAGASDERMDGCYFTAAPDEFGRHSLEVVVTRPMSTGFQGFTLEPGDDSYGARHTSKGSAWYSWCSFAGGVKGIAVTGPDSDLDLMVSFCDFRDIHGGVSAGVYSVRGTARIADCIFEQIGYPRGGERPRDALLKHGVYLQWECVGTIERCWFRNIASHAAQLRGGGTVTDSVAIATANGFLIGHDKADRPDVSGSLSRVIVEGTEDVDSGRNTGVGLWVEHAAVRLEDVVVANNASRGEGAAIRPLDRAQVTIEGLMSLGIPRVVDIDGTQIRMSGPIDVAGETRRIGTRPGASAGGVAPTFRAVDARVPDLGSWPEPARGEVAELVAELLGGLGR